VSGHQAIRRRVALTFDAEHPDRPALPGTTGALLDRLAERAIRASFFVQGRWAEAFPDTVGRIVADGHLVGSHSHYHARMPLLTDAGLAEDLADAAAAIEAAAGVDPRPWFRCPFGAGADDERVLAAIAAAGYRHVGWHVSADDWDPGRSPDVIAAAIVDGVMRRGDETVVLLHAWPAAMLVALDSIVASLAEAGARFVRVDELADPPVGVA
jgi:peptidoglycan/xylan/chitin deacetylase (PgdA/CDA1 family)